MVAKRRLNNPLALAVLGSLWEKPMHPYEIATTLRSRAKHESIKLNYGSLYSVVDGLAQRGWIVPQETEREGRRPERTVYALTEAGNRAYIDWLSELLAVPVKEYTQFEAGLSFLPALPRAEVVRLLRNRCDLLRESIAQQRRYESAISPIAVPRLFRIESEYALTLRQAELDWISGIVDEIEDGTLLLDDEQSRTLLQFMTEADPTSLARLQQWAQEWTRDPHVVSDEERRNDD
jgi:DNA-binding PadR family transcriptional regulator